MGRACIEKGTPSIPLALLALFLIGTLSLLALLTIYMIAKIYTIENMYLQWSTYNLTSQQQIGCRSGNNRLRAWGFV